MKELSEKALLKKVERLEVFEERMRIRLENISIIIDGYEDYNWLKIFCEVHPLTGTSIDESIRIECVIYEKEGAILWSENIIILDSNFFGFELIKFQCQEDNIAENIGKIRIYPKIY